MHAGVWHCGGYRLPRQHPWSSVREGAGSVHWLPPDLIGNCEGREVCVVCVCVCDVWCVSEGCVIVLKRGRVTRYLAIKMCAMVEVCVCVCAECAECVVCEARS